MGKIPNMNVAAHKLAALLKRERLHQSAFAERVGVGSSTVSRWLTGERRPSLELAQRIFDETGGVVTPNDWLCPANEGCSTAA
jgi:transcriptional regulator with XRE-family HTH domain